MGQGQEVQVAPVRGCAEWALVSLCAAVAAMSLFLLGYDIGVVPSTLMHFEQDYPLTTVEVEMLTAVVDLFSIMGSILGGYLADRIGRRRSLIAGGVLFLCSAVVMASSFGFWSLLAGRSLTGIASGATAIVAPLYTSEMSPSDRRGLFVGVVELFLSMGILAGTFSGLFFATLPQGWNWRLMLLSVGVPATVLMVGAFVVPESPRWFAAKRRSQEALRVLTRLSGSAAVAENELESIESLVRMEESNQVSWGELLMPENRGVRKVMVVGCLMALLQQAMGISAVLYYAPRTLEKAGLKSATLQLAGAVSLALVKVACTLVSVLSIDSLGRRPLLLFSALGVVAAHAVAGAAAFSDSEGAAVVLLLALCFYIAVFSLGYGPVIWVYFSEIFPQQTRSRAMSVCISLNRLSSMVVLLTFLSLTELLGVSGALFTYAIAAVIAVNFTYFFVAETKKRSLEDISRAAYADKLDPDVLEDEDVEGASSEDIE